MGEKWQGLAYDVASLPSNGGSYLSLECPVSRHILDYHPSQPYEIVLRALKADRKEPFRAVIVASHKSSNLGRAHEELTIVRERVRAWCHTHNVPPETTILEGPEASCEQLEVILRSLGRVHLLHFCGHCTHNTEEPENSSLAFLDKQGNYDNVNCRKLLHVLEEAQIWLLFLSCCYSGAAASGGIAGGGLSGIVHMQPSRLGLPGL
jgi:CHAT domain-containing protein